MCLNLGEDDTAPTARAATATADAAAAAPAMAADAMTRTYLEDGDEVVLRGEARTAEGVRIGFGECRGIVLPANVPSFHVAAEN